MGNTSFYGTGMTVDTKSKFTVVTQFITADNTASGELSEIRRFYVQNGKVIPNSESKISGVSGNSITDSFCSAQKTAFGDQNAFEKLGGLSAMGDALEKGMVLALSLWDDAAANMLWLDSNYPLDKDASLPGVARGACSTTSGVPSEVRSQYGSSSVTFSNIKSGDIGSTFSASGGGTTTAAPTNPSTTTRSTTTVQSTTAQTTSSTAAPPTTTGVAQYGQCGGNGYTGPTTCTSPYTCKKQNDCAYLSS